MLDEALIRESEYVVGGPVSGDDFYDRTRIIEEFFGSQTSSMAVIGIRRIGKTSILKEIQYTIEETPEKYEGTDRYIPVFITLQLLVGDRNEVFAEFRNRFLRNFTIANWLDDFDETSLGLLTPANFLQDLNEKAKENEKIVIILCDEIERVLKLEEAGGYIVTAFKSVLEVFENIRIVIAATPLVLFLKADSLLDGLMNSDILQSRLIGSFNPKNSEKLCMLTQKCDEPPVPKDIYDKIIRSSGRHPYLMQFLCYQCEDSSDFSAAKKEINKTNEVKSQFDNDVKNLDPLAQKILEKLALCRKIGVKFLTARCNSEPSVVEEHVRRLKKLGLINEDEKNKKYSISNEFFKKWLIQWSEEKDQTKAWRKATFGVGAGFLLLVLTFCLFWHQTSLVSLKPLGWNLVLVFLCFELKWIIFWPLLYGILLVPLAILLKPKWCGYLTTAFAILFAILIGIYSLVLK